MNVDPLSKGEMVRLLAAAKASREEHWLALLVGYLHALRASEVVQIKRVDIKDGFLTVRRGKASETTVQEILTSANPLLNERTALLEYAAHALDPRLFKFTRQTLRNLIQRYGKRAGLAEHQCHPHMLKQACLTHMYEKTKDLPAVQKWAGHKAPGSTLIYMRKTQAQAAEAARSALCG